MQRRMLAGGNQVRNGDGAGRANGRTGDGAHRRSGDTAKGRCGECHEVAKQNSPGLQPWVGSKKDRPEGAADGSCGPGAS
jgi:hypothetical protein